MGAFLGGIAGGVLGRYGGLATGHITYEAHKKVKNSLKKKL